MATHLRNLLSPSQSDPADADADAGGALSCSYTDCHLNSDGYRFCSSYSCFWKTLSPPPPPAAPQTESPQTTHLAPYLIAMVCVLGITFLFLTTCTIILRYRFSQRRNSIRRTSASVGHFAFDDDDHGSPVDHPIWHITTVGLQQSVIDSIAVFKYKKVDGLIEGNDCSVCLTEFQDGDDLRLLPKCSHAFHVSCIDTWLRSHKNCPMCRAPVVNESFWGNFSVGRSSSRDLNSRDEILTGSSTMDGGSESWEGESSHQMRDRGDDFGPLPIEGTRISAMLKKNRELRVLSDLGEQLRFKGGGREGEDFQPIRRSASLDLAAACGIFNDMANVCLEKNEGSSSNASLGQVKLGIEKDVKRGSSMSVLGKCSSSIGRSLQKVPISAKRSSSSSRIFSFRRSKSQASILPL